MTDQRVAVLAGISMSLISTSDRHRSRTKRAAATLPTEHGAWAMLYVPFACCGVFSYC